MATVRFGDVTQIVTPTVQHDHLIGFATDRNREDKQRAESAGVSRELIGEFLDATGFNNKALAWLRQILKVNDKDDGFNKAMDIIRSLQKGLPMIEAHVLGQGTAALDFDKEPEVTDDEVAAIFTAAPEPNFTDGPDDEPEEAGLNDFTEAPPQDDWNENVVRAFGA